MTLGKCSLCPPKRSYRSLSRVADLETTLLAHVINQHHDEAMVQQILEKKR